MSFRPLLLAALLAGIPCAAVAQNAPSSLYWIFLKDKPEAPASLLKASALNIPSRTIQRREKNLPNDRLVDSYDLPVSKTYLDALDALGITRRHTSRWLNAVSVRMTRSQAALVRAWPWVRKVRPLSATNHTLVQELGASDFDYGYAQQQNSRINVIAAHQRGFTGRGVVVGMIDTGFLLQHTCLQSTNVVDSWDFIEDDADVTEDTPSHGTQVLSVIAGQDDGWFVGASPHASFLLARTFDYSSSKAEEDAWIAGLEWLEWHGAQIVCSTITFLDDFYGQDSIYNYYPEDLDGRTAATTLATDIAFDKGVLVINAAGNFGGRGSGYLGTPSDGRKMIAVGALTGDSLRAFFSSRGPTSDGRFKPDVAAPGYRISTASGSSPTEYKTAVSGTSVAAPLVAGLAALALQAHPDWSAKQLYDAIRQTASQSNHPDNDIGYGVPDAVKILDRNYPSPDIQIDSLFRGPNPFSSSIQINFRTKATGRCSVRIYNVLGQEMATLLDNVTIPVNEYVSLSWNGQSHGRRAADGVYFCRIVHEGHSKTIKLLKID